MALATQCPHCHTTFRVASDQLKLRGGIVRCGACQSIFDGNAHLVDLERLKASKATPSDSPSPAPSPAPSLAPSSAPSLAPSWAPEPPAAQPDDADSSSQPVYTLDLGHTFDPLGILPRAEGDDAGEADAPAAPLPGAEVEAEVAPEPAPRARVWRSAGHGLDAAEEPDTAPPRADEPAPAAEQPPADDTPPWNSLAAPVRSEPVLDAPGPAPEPAPGPEPVPEPEPASEEPTEVPPASAYAPPGRIEPSFGLQVDEELVAQPLPGGEHELEHGLEHGLEHEDAPAEAASASPAASATAGPAPRDDIPPTALPLRASAASELPAPPPAVPQARSARAKAAEARARRSRLTPTRIDAPKLRLPASVDADEPEFVKRSRKQERMGRLRPILLGVGAIVLLLLLASQVILNFRDVLAARHPAARPVLAAGCAVLGCRIALPAQSESLAIETGELQTLGADTYSLNTLLRNQGSLVQAWPSVALELTDANDKPVLRRVFGPADYLPQGVPVAAGFAAHSEQPIRLNFALAELKPSGYHIAVFYP